MKTLILLMLLFPSIAFSQVEMPGKEPYRVRSVVIPATLSLAAGMAANTDPGRIGQQTCLFGATFAIGLTKKPTVKTVLINFGISGAAFLAGRGLREVVK